MPGSLPWKYITKGFTETGKVDAESLQPYLKQYTLKVKGGYKSEQCV